MSRADEPRTPGTAAPVIPPDIPRLSPGVVFEGELASSEDILIQGEFKGTLRLLPQASVYIDRGARVEASVTAGNVYVFGALIGPAQASACVFLSAEAEMKGDISAARLFVQEGARFRGSVQTTAD